MFLLSKNVLYHFLYSRSVVMSKLNFCLRFFFIWNVYLKFCPRKVSTLHLWNIFLSRVFFFPFQHFTDTIPLSSCLHDIYWEVHCNYFPWYSYVMPIFLWLPLRFAVFGFLLEVWIWCSQMLGFWKSLSFFKYFFCPLFSLFSWIPFMHMLNHLMLPNSFWMLCSVFLSFFFFLFVFHFGQSLLIYIFKLIGSFLNRVKSTSLIYWRYSLSLLLNCSF